MNPSTPLATHVAVREGRILGIGTKEDMAAFGPDGRAWPRLKSIGEVVARLREIERGMEDADAPLTAWGFDPIHFGGQRVVRADLDWVSRV